MIEIDSSRKLFREQIHLDMPDTQRQHHPASYMVITDLDGTLLRANGTFSRTDLNTLKELGHRNILRVIATGRSLFSANTVIPPDLPIDYLIFSSGAGIMHWKTQKLLITHNLASAEIRQAFELLHAYKLDFMLHYPIPDNHRFLYHDTMRHNPDFQRRYQRYRQFAARLDLSKPLIQTACQFVAIDPSPGKSSCYAVIQRHLPDLKVIRSTSPMDGISTWIEIFPATVSKGLAGDWVARQHNVQTTATLAVGNDYNDLDVLDWAGRSIVVSNAPADLKQQYQTTINSHDENGFTESVTLWLEEAFPHASGTTGGK